MILRARTRWILGSFIGVSFVSLLASLVLGFRHPLDHAWDVIGVVTAVSILVGVSVLHRCEWP